MSEDFPELPSASGWSKLPAFQDFGDLIGPAAGPINWEVAKQVATWVGTEGQSEIKPDPAEAGQIEDLVRLAELRVAEYTQLPFGSQSGQVGVVNRTGWIDSSINGFRYILNKLAERLSATMRADADHQNPLEAIIEPIMPAIFGAQIGILLGYMSTKILGQFDILLPRTDGSRIYMVSPNLNSIVEGYDLQRDEFMLWVATHEVAHQVEFGIPWVRRRFTRLVEEAIDQIEIDPDAIADRFTSIDLTSVDSLESVFGDPAGMLGVMFTPADAERIAELHTFMTVVEGYAEHVMDEAISDVVPSVGAMREVLARHRADRSTSEKLLERLLGLDLKRKQYAQGEEFCRAVVHDSGLEVLNKMWEAEGNLPTADELGMPQMWQLRMEPGK
ncbi:MAG: hypothetical protein DCC49_12325 [Acidobacteria bacterium]|nr:MAG: hypothetical protein DCC49_12325 [Acidobacteriota bacterium]